VEGRTYRDFAVQCIALANDSAADAKWHAVLFEMAATWTKLAEECERNCLPDAN